MAASTPTMPRTPSGSAQRTNDLTGPTERRALSASRTPVISFPGVQPLVPWTATSTNRMYARVTRYAAGVGGSAMYTRPPIWKVGCSLSITRASARVNSMTVLPA